jgi:hypothetical protein
LLLTMRRVVEAVQVEGQSRGRRLERVEELVNEQFPQTEQRGDNDGILEPRERRLGRGPGSRRIVRHAVAYQLKNGIVAERVVIVLVFVASDEAIHRAAAPATVASGPDRKACRGARRPNCSVSPIRSSNSRTNKSHASLDTSFPETSTTTGFLE